MAGRVGALVVGAGSGQRMGGVEKAFLEVAGRPLLCYAVEAFERAAAVDDVCLVVSAGSVTRAQALCRLSGWCKVVAVVPGGQQRQDSVRAGLEALAGCDVVLVHDAARPLLTAEIIRRGLDAAAETGAAVAATPVRDTLKRVDGDGLVAQTVDRSGVWAAQTPQVFRMSVLRAAFAAAGDRANTFTDDASMVEATGVAVRVFDGSAHNVKLTLLEDVALVEALLQVQREDVAAPAGRPAPGLP